MQFYRIEKALNDLVNESMTEGRFYQTAGAFENILRDENLTPEEQAEKISEILEEGIQS